MDGPNLFRELIKRGEVIDNTRTTASPAAARAVMKDWHPNVPQPAAAPLAKRKGSYTKTADVFETNHDTPTPVDALGSMSGDTSTQDQPTVDVLLDIDLLSSKVRNLVESAGMQYNYKAAAADGLIKRVDPELLGAIRRLQNAAPLLSHAVAKAIRKR